MGGDHGRKRRIEPLEMGMQIPRSLHSEWQTSERERQKGCEIDEGHLMPDHVHMLISISPKVSVSRVIGYIKWKSAIHLARTSRTYEERKRNSYGQGFWARGYYVSTVGRDEEVVRENDSETGEVEDIRRDQMNLF
jgi:putative transposase